MSEAESERPQSARETRGSGVSEDPAPAVDVLPLCWDSWYEVLFFPTWDLIHLESVQISPFLLKEIICAPTECTAYKSLSPVVTFNPSLHWNFF